MSSAFHFGTHNFSNKIILFIFQVPFSSDRKFMSVQERHNETGVSLQYTKGAIEEILPRCKQYNANGSSQPLDQKDAYVLEQAANLMANRGLRVLAFARGRTLVDLEFVGLFGLHDPPRQVTIFTLLDPTPPSPSEKRKKN